jgi:signal transduction histidine kinase
VGTEEQSELARKKRLLNILAWGGAAACLFFLVAMLVPPISPLPFFVTFGLLLLVCLATLVLNRQGYYLPAALLFLGSVTLAIFGVELTGLLQAQVLSFGIYFFPFTVLGAGMLLGSRSTFVFATLNVVPIVILGLVAGSQASPESELIVAEVMGITIPAAVLCYLMALVAWLYTSSLEKALHQLRNRSRELEVANKEIRAFSRTLEDKVEERTQELREFVSMVAHDLRNPLTTVQGYTELMQEEQLGSMSPSQLRALKTVANNIQHMILLTEDLLEISRLQSGGVQFHMEPLPIEGVIHEVCTGFEQRLHEKHLGLKMDLPSQLPPVLGDRFRLTQVLNNLVGNACNYTPSGAIMIGAQPSNGYVEISVSDTGIGIPPEELKRLFTHFFRGDHEVVRGQKGTGLGLTITRSIVEAHGGTIWVESEVNKGTTFRFTVPAIQELPAEWEAEPSY